MRQFTAQHKKKTVVDTYKIDWATEQQRLSKDLKGVEREVDRILETFNPPRNTVSASL